MITYSGADYVLHVGGPPLPERTRPDDGTGLFAWLLRLCAIGTTVYAVLMLSESPFVTGLIAEGADLAAQGVPADFATHSITRP